MITQAQADEIKRLAAQYGEDCGAGAAVASCDSYRALRAFIDSLTAKDDDADQG